MINPTQQQALAAPPEPSTSPSDQLIGYSPVYAPTPPPKAPTEAPLAHPPAFDLVWVVLLSLTVGAAMGALMLDATLSGKDIRALESQAQTSAQQLDQIRSILSCPQ